MSQEEEFNHKDLLRQEALNKQRMIFGNLFYIPNRLQVMIDEGLAKYELTAKQWFLMAVMDEFFKSPPTLTEVAERMGSTRQNVKQLALKLAEKGFLKIDNDLVDRRALRLSLTEKCYAFWKNREQVDVNFMDDMFSDLTPDELNLINSGLIKIARKISK